jgi:hypothetical protein
MRKRTGDYVGPGKYVPDNNQTIVANVNRSHHAVNMPVMGRPFPKETTIQTYGNLNLYDPTFSSEKYKKENRTLWRSTIQHRSDLYKNEAPNLTESNKNTDLPQET